MDVHLIVPSGPEASQAKELAGHLVFVSCRCRKLAIFLPEAVLVYVGLSKALP